MTDAATDDLAARVTRLERAVAKQEAVEEIRRLKHAYAALCDAGYPPDELASMFTADGVWDGGERFGVHRGRAGVRRFFAEIEAEVDFALHFMIGDSIVVADDCRTARGTWQLLELATMVVDGEPKPFWLIGIYDDEYRREPDGWKFASVRLEWRTQFNHADGWADELLQL